MEIDIPWRPYSDIWTAAEAFLSEHYPTLEIPIPVENIVESLGIDIVPIPGLQSTCDTDAFTCSDLSSIGVDDYIYRYRENRYRFSLAHELGHVVLHRGIYQAGHWTDIGTWKERVRRFPDALYDRLERQADEFAGALLLPRSLALREIESCRQTIAGVLPDVEKEDPPQYRAFLSECLAKRFVVSAKCAEIRLGRLRLP